MEKKVSTIKILNDPAADKGNGIQELGACHARLFLHVNIWQRASIWVHPLRSRDTLNYYAFLMYCRVIRHYGLDHPVPDEKLPLDPIWLSDDPVTYNGTRETDNQVLARMLYTVAFSYELSFGWYLSHYIVSHVGKWNRRVDIEREKTRESEKILYSLEEIVAWTKLKDTEEEVGITSDNLRYPLANCHNERDGLLQWSFTETCAENGSCEYPYPPALKEIVRQIDLAYPDQSITAGQLLSILAFYDVAAK